MRIHKISYPDIENGLGFRCSIFVSGCIHHCKYCQNPETWNKMSGREMTEEDKEKIYSILSKPYMKGVTFTGGDPLSFYMEDVYEFCKELKSRFPKKDIWLFTGYTKTEILQSDKRKIFDVIDVLVDGKFEKEEKDAALEFRGSRNQNVYSVKKIKENEYAFKKIYYTK